MARVGEESLKDEVIALKRERILQKAADLFYERGYVQTSMDAIAEELGATKQFVYYHFSSKTDLIVDICERQVRDAVAATDKAMSSKAPVLERFQAFLRDFTTAVLKDHKFVAIYFREEINLPKEAGDRIAAMRKTLGRRLRTLLSEGHATGVFDKDDVHTTALLIAGMSSFAFAWYRDGGRLPREEVTELIVKMATKAVKA